MIRDLSPTVWAAPGTAELALLLRIGTHGADDVPLDRWVSNYSPSYDAPRNLSSGFNEITVPDTTNCRFFILIPPRGNTVSITLKGVTGDTGLAQNPNGPIVLSLPATSPPASIGITTGDTITGCRVIFL